MKIFQKGFNYSQDGQGNRLVYHLQGCNMKCPWCANPEGMRPEGVIVADAEWLFPEICPHGAVREKKVDRSVCRGCKKRECITCHRTKGMYLSYTEYTVEEILKECISSSMMFYDGGGVTFTGGEATLQFDELKELLACLKKNGIRTAIETNGTHPCLPELFPLLDQLIMDCKHCDSARHKETTGVSNERILDNIHKAAKEHPAFHMRIPMIGGFNDHPEDFEEFLDLIREIKGENVSVEVLTYHEFGKKKWAECGWEYKMTGNAFIKDETAAAFRKAIQDTGVRYCKT